MKRILVLGAGFYHRRIYIHLKDGGYHIIGADKNPGAEAAPLAHAFYPVDIADADAVTDLARRTRVQAVMPLNEFGMRAHAAAVETLGLLGNSRKSAEWVVDKEAMRLRWAEASLPQPSFAAFGGRDESGDLEEARRAAKQVGFPCVIKPADSGGSGRGVLILHGEEDMEEGVAFARPFARNGRMLLENFIGGTEMTIEGLVVDGAHTILATSDKEKPPLRTRVSTSLNYPAKFKGRVMARVHDVVHEAVHCLGLTHSATHTEVIVTPEGEPRLVEMGARGGGGHVFSDLVGLVSGGGHAPGAGANPLRRTSRPERAVATRGLLSIFQPAAGRVARGAWPGKGLGPARGGGHRHVQTARGHGGGAEQQPAPGRIRGHQGAGQERGLGTGQRRGALRRIRDRTRGPIIFIKKSVTMKFEDMVEFELNIQKDRLRYIETVLAGRTECPFPPRKIYLEPTNICNYRCVHCVHDGAMTRSPGYLDADLYKRRLNEIAHLRLHVKIQFTGVGEPLLHPRWHEIIRHAADMGFFTLMNSNASLLTPENSAKLVESGLDYLHVSLDGLTKATYESIRRGGDFEKVIGNLFNLFEARHKAKGYHLAVVLGIIDQDRNREELKRFMAYFGKWPFHHVVSGELFNHMGTVEEANLACADRQALPRDRHPVCNTPWDLLSINCDGQAVACNYDYDNRYVIGDLHDAGFLELWNAEPMQRFRKATLDRDFEAIEGNGPLCSACSIKWQKDYHLPSNFSSEIERMEEYLVRAIHRCAHHRERNLEFRHMEERLLLRRREVLEGVMAFAE